MLRAGPAFLPLALLFVPKCPLCVLPLFAAVGAVLPPAPVLDALVGLTALLWLALLARARPGAAALAAGLVGALVLLGSRLLDLPAASWAGALAIAAVALKVRATNLRRKASACERPDACGNVPATYGV
ncbi:MAG: hypothetical protein ACRD00_07415 [Thermoanaerobaculia bacterium]